MSKKPPLGAKYFQQLAETYVEQGLAPQVLEYTFSDVRRRKKDGSQEVVPFRLLDRSAELFLEHYVNTWRRVNPGKHLPNSEIVEEFIDPGAWKVREDVPKGPIQAQPKRAGANDIVRLGPWDLGEWSEQYERQNLSGQERQREKEWAEQVQRRTDAICEAVYGRQGRVAVKTDSGETVYRAEADVLRAARSDSERDGGEGAERPD